MIISHHHHYIFFAIPKTGTHTIREALRSSLASGDEEQVGLFVQKRFAFPELANIRHGHISAQQIRPVLGERAFSTYFKFAFVRNPYARFVSFCAFMTRETGEFVHKPGATMRELITSPQVRNHLLCRPQAEVITDSLGKITMDYVGRTETMQQSFNEICARLQLPQVSLGRVNCSEHRDWRSYYDSDLICLVKDAFRQDLELFHYDFDHDAY